MRGLAYAKINLTLEVTGKRPDGYHELISIMQTVALADKLSLDPATELSLECDVPELAGDDNLVLRAARLLGRGGRFVLGKRIPVAGGLGGGSGDAALALRLLDAAYGLHLSPHQFLDAAAQLGSDVPFFIHGGTALVEGRGEQVTPLPDLPEHWLVLLNPGLPLSTARVYGELKPDEYTAASPSPAAAGEGRGEGAWRRGDDRASRSGPLPPAGERSEHDLPRLVNTLEAPALRLEPAIGECRERLLAAGSSQVLLSGSGPTVFGLAASEADAYRIAKQTDGIATCFARRKQAIQLQPD
ncbi:MAG TPA: 4-(cytidine 5'-diphospho)-2-C-methyl-D-erythritol kinase [Chloroflexota bacterium]|nr:4-(cytidine 5'-diphospho)-2-C-methyl-D-erythritol kinase [Chloroflexota bacterium]